MQNEIKALPKITECGSLYASMDDTADGQHINSGSIIMGQHAGTAMITRNGKKYTVEILHDMGSSVCIQHGGRSFRLNIEWLIDQAMEAGLCEPNTLDFKRDTSTKE